MIQRLHVLPALLLAILLTGNAQAGFLLFQRAINVDHNPNIFDTNQFDLDLIFGDDYFTPTNGVTLFDSLVISPANVGSSYDATSANDPAFATVAGRITDALNEIIKVALTEDQTGGISEQRGWAENFFFGNVAPSLPPDLAGFVIERVELHIDSFVFLSKAPSGSSSTLTAEMPFDLDFTVSIYAVPEPAAWTLLVGLTAMGFARCRRQQAAIA